MDLIKEDNLKIEQENENISMEEPQKKIGTKIRYNIKFISSLSWFINIGDV